MNADEHACDKCEKDRSALERLLVAVLAVVDTGIAVFDERGRFIMANPSFQALFRWRGGLLRSETFASLFPDAELPSSMIRLPRSISAGRYQTCVRAGDGALIAVEVHARWITHEDADSYWLAALKPITGAGPSGSAQGKPEAADSAAIETSFAQALRERIRTSVLGPRVMAGQVEITKLDAVEQAAGEQWPRVATHIYAEAETILARNLSAADAFMHDGLGAFTICFGEATRDEAERQVEAIMQDVRDHLTGRFGATAAPDARGLIDQVFVPPDEAAVPDIGAFIATKLAERRTLIERVSHMTLSQVIETATLDPQEVISGNGTLSPLLVARLDRTTSRAVRKAAMVSSNASGINSQIDHLLLGVTATRIYERLATAAPPTFIVPVSFATFTNRRLLDRYLGLCRNLSAGVAQHLMFELVGVPDDVASMRIEDIIASLRPFSRYQCLRLPGLDRWAAKPWERYFTHFTILFDDIEPIKRAPEFLRPIVDTMHQRRCRIGVEDVSDQATACVLSEAGVDFISGAGLVPWSGA